MTMSNLLKYLHLIAQGLNIVDFVLSYYFIFIKEVAREGNFLPAFLIDLFGPMGLVITKLFSASLIYGLFWAIKKIKK